MSNFLFARLILKNLSNKFFRAPLKHRLKMTEEQQFCLRWNDFQTNMVASFKHLRDEKSFCDVTIATEVK